MKVNSPIAEGAASQSDSTSGSHETSKREANPLREALSEVARGKVNLEKAAVFTIGDAVNGLRYDEHGNEKNLTPDQVRDVHKALFKASASQLPPEDREAVLRELDLGVKIFPPIIPEPQLKSIIRDKV